MLSVVHEKRGDETDQHRIEIVIVHHGVQTGPVVGARTGGQDVHGIVDRGFGKELFLENGLGFFGQGRQLQTGTHQNIRGDDRRAAGIGDDAHPVAVGDGLGGKGRCCGDQLPFVHEVQYTGFFEYEVRGQILFGQAARVGGRRLCAGFGASGFHGQYGFFGRHLGGHFHEGGRVSQTLHIGDDDPVPSSSPRYRMSSGMVMSQALPLEA